MICVHPTDSTYPPASLKADGWIIDTETGYLTVTDSGRHVAVFAPTAWRYVEHDEPAASSPETGQ